VGMRDLSAAARTLTGSVTDGILRNAELPVVVVREGQPFPEPGLHRLLVGVDRSQPSEGAAVFAAALGLEGGIRLILCAVVATDRAGDPLGAAARDAVDAGVEYANAVDLYPDTQIIEASDAVSGLLDAAQRERADAIVVGTHGRRHLERVVLGSTAESVVRRSGIPVIVIPARARLLPDFLAARV